ncbi:MAG: hypothetical protein ACI9S8_000465 [Chlamydiales bacterium]|jgi:hypothetical protein
MVSSLTDKNVGDPTEVPNLLEKINKPIDEFIGDGAYDTKQVYNAVKSRGKEGKRAVTVPPQKMQCYLQDSKAIQLKGMSMWIL